MRRSARRRRADRTRRGEAYARAGHSSRTYPASVQRVEAGVRQDHRGRLDRSGRGVGIIEFPVGTTRCSSALGRRSTVGHPPLEQAIGVRILASQPISLTHVRSFGCPQFFLRRTALAVTGAESPRPPRSVGPHVSPRLALLCAATFLRGRSELLVSFPGRTALAVTGAESPASARAQSSRTSPRLALLAATSRLTALRALASLCSPHLVVWRCFASRLPHVSSPQRAILCHCERLS